LAWTMPISSCLPISKAYTVDGMQSGKTFSSRRCSVCHGSTNQEAKIQKASQRDIEDHHINKYYYY
jgi:hypothetical protein